MTNELLLKEHSFLYNEPIGKNMGTLFARRVILFSHTKMNSYK